MTDLNQTTPTPAAKSAAGSKRGWLAAIAVGTAAAIIAVASLVIGALTLPKLADASKTVDLVTLLAKANTAQQAVATELNEVTMQGVTDREPDTGRTDEAVRALSKQGKPLIGSLPLGADEWGRRAEALLDDGYARIERARFFSLQGIRDSDKDVVQYSTLEEDVSTIAEVIPQAIPDQDIRDQVRAYLDGVRGLPVPVIAEGIEDVRGEAIRAIENEARSKAATPRTGVMIWFGTALVELVVSAVALVHGLKRRRKAKLASAGAASSAIAGAPGIGGEGEAAKKDEPAEPVAKSGKMPKISRKAKKKAKAAQVEPGVSVGVQGADAVVGSGAGVAGAPGGASLTGVAGAGGAPGTGGSAGAVSAGGTLGGASAAGTAGVAGAGVAPGAAGAGTAGSAGGVGSAGVAGASGAPGAAAPGAFGAGAAAGAGQAGAPGTAPRPGSAAPGSAGRPATTPGTTAPAYSTTRPGGPFASTRPGAPSGAGTPSPAPGGSAATPGSGPAAPGGAAPAAGGTGASTAGGKTGTGGPGASSSASEGTADKGKAAGPKIPWRTTKPGGGNGK